MAAQQHRAGHYPASAEPGHQPAGRRRHNRRCQDVEGHDPGNLVLGRRHRALHLRQQGRGDQQSRRIERRAQHDRGRDHPTPRERRRVVGDVIAWRCRLGCRRARGLAPHRRRNLVFPQGHHRPALVSPRTFSLGCSSRPRTAYRSSRRPSPLSNPRNTSSDRSSPASGTSPGRGRCVASSIRSRDIAVLGARSNGRDAPIPALAGKAVQPPGSTPYRRIRKSSWRFAPTEDC